MFSSLLLIQAALAIASPTSILARKEVIDSDLPTELLLRYDHVIGSDQSELVLSKLDKTEVYAQACGDTFDVAGKTIAISIDEQGSGTLAVDDKEYKVVGDRKISGGISCSKVYSESSITVECSIPWSDFQDATALSPDAVQECFENSAARRRSFPDSFSHPFSEIEKRQGFGTYSGCYSSVGQEVHLVGNGDPHNDVLWKQVGKSQTCAPLADGSDPTTPTTCFVGVGEEVSISVTAELGGGYGWIGGGFSVTETKSSSTERGCYGASGDTVCQWTKTYHTRYTVQSQFVDRCNGIKSSDGSDPYNIRSPNDDSQSVEWLCMVNRCAGDGDSFWDFDITGLLPSKNN